MPSRVMTAGQAYNEFGYKFKSMVMRGNSVTMLNSMGKPMTLGKNQEVYHRGHGKFALYSASTDAKRVGVVWSGQRRDGKNVGRGRFRNQHDGIPR